MKRGKSYDWIPLWIDKWLMGSTRFELDPGERSVFLDLLVLAAKDDGFIRANSEMGYPHEYLARILNVSIELLESSLVKCAQFGKIEEKGSGIYYIKNWKEYSLSVSHKKRLLSEAKKANDTELSHSETVVDSASKSLSKSKSLSSSKGKSAEKGKIQLILDDEPKRWEGISESDKALWTKTYPGCAVEITLQEMIAYWDAQPKSKLKINWKRTIVSRLKWLQDHGGTKGASAKSDRLAGVREWVEQRGIK